MNAALNWIKLKSVRCFALLVGKNFAEPEEQANGKKINGVLSGYFNFEININNFNETAATSAWRFAFANKKVVYGFNADPDGFMMKKRFYFNKIFIVSSMQSGILIEA